MTTPDIAKRIQFNRSTKDFDCYVAIDGAAEQYIGSAANYSDGEIRCDEYAYNHYIDSWTPERAAQLIMAQA